MTEIDLPAPIVGRAIGALLKVGSESTNQKVNFDQRVSE